jgi:peptidoglycan/LPS O-acetylase OafA/YrhL
MSSLDRQGLSAQGRKFNGVCGCRRHRVRGDRRAVCGIGAGAPAAYRGARGPSCAYRRASRFAALFVFFCHSAVWLSFAKTGRWANAPAPVYGNLGLDGVIVFFMITGYLFGSKLLTTHDGRIDWLRLFVSRALRLTPLYLFALLVMLVVVSASTGFGWNEPAGSWVPPLANWLVFAIWGTPDLHGMSDTWMVTAGVTWSLRYE